MSGIGKNSAGGFWAAGVIFALLCIVVACAGANSSGSSTDPLSGMGRVLRTNAGDAPATIRHAGGKTLADTAARIELASDYNKSSPRDLATEALPDAYALAAWTTVEPVSRTTGESQSGYITSDLFTALDYESNPDAYTSGPFYNLNHLQILRKGDRLAAGITMLQDEDVDFQTDANGNGYAYVNVIFDLPSGKHRYMKMLIFPATHGGVVIDDKSAVELFAQTMTTEYTHILLPIVGQNETTELMFYNEPFRDLLPKSERATAVAVMKRNDATASQ